MWLSTVALTQGTYTNLGYNRACQKGNEKYVICAMRKDMPYD